MRFLKNPFFICAYFFLYAFSTKAQNQIHSPNGFASIKNSISDYQIKNPKSIFSQDNKKIESKFIEAILEKNKKIISEERKQQIRIQAIKSKAQNFNGGGSSNGGGGGLTCQTSNGPAVLINDYWESKKYGPLYAVRDNESALQYLDRILETQIKMIDSYFYLRLKEAIGEVLEARWTAQSSLPLVSDLGELDPAIPSDCTPVQVAIRYSFSSPGYRPEIFIDYDPVLLAKLDSQNLAMLLLHEAIYVWGTELHQQNSSSVRALVNRLLSATKQPQHLMLGKLDLISNNVRAISFADEIRQLGFGSFVNLYEKEIYLKSLTSLSAHRQLVYARMINRLNHDSGDQSPSTEEEDFFRFFYLLSNDLSENSKTLEDFIQSSEPETVEIRRVCEIAKTISQQGALSVSRMMVESFTPLTLKYCKSALR